MSCFFLIQNQEKCEVKVSMFVLGYILTSPRNLESIMYEKTLIFRIQRLIKSIKKASFSGASSKDKWCLSDFRVARHVYL